MKLKSLILLAFVAALSACSFEKNDSIDASGENQIREKLRSAYDSVAGTYQGTLQISNGANQIIKVRLYRLEKDDDSNSSGASRKIPVLVGNYTKVSPIGPGYEFDARYYEGKKELIMTNVGTNLNNDDVHTISAQIINGHIIGKAITKGGYQGNIDLPLITRESAGTGDTTEDNEYYDNLRRQYQEIAGIYEGKIMRADGKVFMAATITLSIENNKSPTNPEISIPSLVGKMHDLNENMGQDGAGNPIGMSDVNFTSVYNTKVTPRRLTLYGVPVYGGESNPFRSSLESKIELDANGTMVFYGTYTQKPASFTGEFMFTRKALITTDEKN
jgi:hypothetical protein